jgi:hypothetical protein
MHSTLAGFNTCTQEAASHQKMYRCSSQSGLNEGLWSLTVESLVTLAEDLLQVKATVAATVATPVAALGAHLLADLRQAAQNIL